MDDTLKFRASEEQIARWKTAAGGRALSAWIRDTLDAAAGEGTSPLPVTVSRGPGASDDAPEAAPAQTAEHADLHPTEPVAASAVAPNDAPVRPRRVVDPETLTDEEYALWLDEYPSRAMAPGYTIKEWRALTPMARAAAAIRGGPLSAA